MLTSASSATLWARTSSTTCTSSSACVGGTGTVGCALALVSLVPPPVFCPAFSSLTCCRSFSSSSCTAPKFVRCSVAAAAFAVGPRTLFSCALASLAIFGMVVSSSFLTASASSATYSGSPLTALSPTVPISACLHLQPVHYYFLFSISTSRSCSSEFHRAILSSLSWKSSRSFAVMPFCAPHYVAHSCIAP